MNCSDFHDLIQRRLDGDIHDQRRGPSCAFGELAPCRRLEAATRRLETALDLMAPAKPSSGLGGRIVARVMADRRARMRFRRQLLAGAAAAGVLLTAVLAYQRSGRPAPGAPLQTAQIQPAAPQRTRVSLQASVREAGTALSGSRRTNCRRSRRGRTRALPYESSVANGVRCRHFALRATGSFASRSRPRLVRRIRTGGDVGSASRRPVSARSAIRK